MSERASLAAEALSETVSILILKPSRSCGSCLPSAEGSVGVLGDLLVGLLADTGGGTLDGLGDVVESLLGGLHCEVVGGFGG